MRTLNIGPSRKRREMVYHRIRFRRPTERNRVLTNKKAKK